VTVLALHVVDEAATHFLDFYNPLVVSIRSWWPWAPMPTFTFDVWLSGLLVAVILLALLTPCVRHRTHGMRIVVWAFSVLMFLNGLGHLVGSLYFRRRLRGASTAPLLLVASALLAKRTHERVHVASR
jgi:hypothetical protein